LACAARFRPPGAFEACRLLCSPRDYCPAVKMSTEFAKRNPVLANFIPDCLEDAVDAVLPDEWEATMEQSVKHAAGARGPLAAADPFLGSPAIFWCPMRRRRAAARGRREDLAVPTCPARAAAAPPHAAGCLVRRGSGGGAEGSGRGR